MSTDSSASHPVGIPHTSGLPHKVLKRIFQAIFEIKGIDSFQTIRRLISACPEAFWSFESDMAWILTQAFESLIVQSPKVWELRRVREMALVIASTTPRSTHGRVLTYQEMADYIRRSQGLSEPSQANQVPMRQAFRPPGNIRVLTGLIGVISPITPFLIRVVDNMTYNGPEIGFRIPGSRKRKRS